MSRIESANRFSDESQPTQSTWVPVIAVSLTLLAGWLFVLHPAKQQIASLESQCEELRQIVKDLAGKSAEIERSTAVLALVNHQAAVVDSAEQSLAKLEGFHQSLSQRLDDIQMSHSTLDCLDEVEQTAILERQSLANVLDALNSLSETHRMVDAGIAIVPDVRDSLNILDDLHVELAAQRQDALYATKALGNLQQICNMLITSRTQVEEATGVAERWATTQNKLVKQTEQLDAADQAATRLVAINSLLSSQGAETLRSRRNLDRLVTVNQQLESQDELLTAAENTLQQITAMAPAVDQATSTINAIQRLVVDVCLTHPADAYSVASSTLRNGIPPITPQQTAKADVTNPEASEDNEAWDNMRQAFQLVPYLINLR